MKELNTLKFAVQLIHMLTDHKNKPEKTQSKSPKLESETIPNSEL